MKKIFLIGLLCFSSLLRAEVINYNPLPVEVASGDQLRVRNFWGSIKLTNNEKAKQLLVKVKQDNPSQPPSFAKSLMDEWALSIQKDGSVIEVVVRSPQGKADWRQYLIQGGAPKFDIEIIGPSLPATLSTKKGNVSVAKWQHRLNINAQEGNVKVENGNGDLNVVAPSGEVLILTQLGNVGVDSFSSQVKCRNIKGRLRVENFGGETDVGQVEGPLEIYASKGGTKVNQAKGGLEFYNGEGNFKVENLEGALKGKADRGPFIADLLGEVEVRIQAKDAPITISAPNSGASLNLGTKDGSFSVPSYLSSYETSNLKMVQGRMRGGVKGQIYVRTENGNIRVR